MAYLNFKLKGRVPSKKNSRINTRSGRSFPSKKYTEWHKDASAQLPKVKAPIEKDAIVSIAFWSPDKRKYDLSNKAESLMDLMVDNGILLDDNYAVVPSLNLIYMDVSYGNPRVEIEISY